MTVPYDHGGITSGAHDYGMTLQFCRKCNLSLHLIFPPNNGRTSDLVLPPMQRIGNRLQVARPYPDHSTARAINFRYEKQ